jgi:hypothetical protein
VQVIAVPFVVLSNMRLSRRQKWVLYSLFSLEIITVLVAIMRCVLVAVGMSAMKMDLIVLLVLTQIAAATCTSPIGATLRVIQSTLTKFQLFWSRVSVLYAAFSRKIPPPGIPTTVTAPPNAIARPNLCPPPIRKANRAYRFANIVEQTPRRLRMSSCSS